MQSVDVNFNKEEKWLLEEGFGGEKSEAFFAALTHLKAGEPLAYLIGSIPFLNCNIYLDSKPLIPRTETEFWTERAIEEIKSAAPVAPRILDLCAGSGCIGTAVAKSIPKARVDFSEIDPAHFPTIKKNLKENVSSDYISKIIQSDLLQDIIGTYDFILTNPPYIDPELDRTEAAVVGFEPKIALYGGRGGLELIYHIITAAPATLSPKGQLWIEHEPEQSKDIRAIATKNNFSCVTKKDQYNIERYSILVLQ